jgi:predicted transcriptional regulator
MTHPVYLTVQVPASLRAEVDHLAHDLQQTTSEIVRLALVEYLAGRKSGPVSALKKLAQPAAHCELVDVFSRWTNAGVS